MEIKTENTPKTENASKRIRNYFTLKNTPKEWITASVIFLFIFALLTAYLTVRRGGWISGLFIPNKSLSLTSALFLMYSMILSPIGQLRGKLPKNIASRRVYGIIGAVTMIIHIIWSLFFIQDRFPLSFYAEPNHIYSIIFGTVGLVIFSMCLYFSYENKVRNRSAADIKTIHRTGYIGVAMIIVHMLLLGTGVNVINWLKQYVLFYDGSPIEWVAGQSNAWMPGATFFIYLASLIFFAIVFTAFFKRVKK
ncbi:MAG: hypothetical protein ACRC9Q_00300 [Bacteroidales bacterium]